MKYEILTTKDGSPSLKALGAFEAMHSLNGAFSESVAVYLDAMEKAWDLNRESQGLRVLSVGLGAGYNEILFAGLALSRGDEIAVIHSCEIDIFLVDEFKHFLAGRRGELTAVYQKICQLTAEHFSLNPAALLARLNLMYSKNPNLVTGDLRDLLNAPQSFHCLLYDPFSANTNPELWSDEFLNSLTAMMCAPNCIFATYAAKGALTRALKKADFEVQLLPGFMGKRNRTLARRQISGQ